MKPLRQPKEPIPLTRKKNAAPAGQDSRPRVGSLVRRRQPTANRRQTDPWLVPSARIASSLQPAPEVTHPCWPEVVAVTLHSDHNFYCGFSRDVESSGLFVATYTVLAPGDRMVVSFTVPGRQGTATALCEARWVREYTARTLESVPGIGFRFVRIDAHTFAAVQRFMEVREPIFWD